MKILRIIIAHIKELFNMNDDLRTKRMEICKECPLYEYTFLGPMCNPSMYMKPDTFEVSHFKQEGFYPGCGCRLDAKTREEDEHCKFNKW